MAATRISRLKLLSSSVKSAAIFDARPSSAYASKCYHTRESQNVQKFDQNRYAVIGFSSAHLPQYSRGSISDLGFSSRVLHNSGNRSSLSFAGIIPLTNYHFFSSASEGKVDTTADAAGASVSDSTIGGDYWIPKVKEAWQSAVETVKYSTEKAKEASDEAAPHIHLWLDTHPYLSDVIVPVGGTLAGTLLAWSLLPWLFRRFHKYSVEGPGALLSKSSMWGAVPYGQSFWGALDVPVRYYITFLAFLNMKL